MTGGAVLITHPRVGGVVEAVVFTLNISWQEQVWHR
jgi:hypothetical protein